MYILLLFFLLTSPNTFDHIYILYTNDIEGGLSPNTAWWMNPYFPPPTGNGAAAAHIIASKRQEADSLGYGFLLFDSGDMFMGTPLGEFSQGKAVAEYFNYCRYDVVAPGNHDYDLGVDVFQKFVDQVDAVFLGSNIVYKDTKDVVDYLEPFVILEHYGIKIGIFSILTHFMAGMTTPERFVGHDVLEETVTAEKYVEILEQHNVDLIFALTGIGLRHDKRVASAVPGIDVIFGSHSSTALSSPYEDPLNHTIICQAYSHLSSIGFLDLWIDTKTNKIAGYKGELIDLLSEEIESDTVMLAKIKAWEEITHEGFDKVVGYSNGEMVRTGFEETAIGNLITDAMREFFDVDVAIHNSGGIRANLPKGEITYRNCYSIDALSNTAVVMKMNGKILIQALEIGFNGHHAIFQVSGLNIKYDSKRPINNRIIEVTTDKGALIDTSETYTIVTNSYLAAGGGEYAIFKSGIDITDTFYYLRNIIAHYIEKHTPVSSKVEGRIIDISRQ